MPGGMSGSCFFQKNFARALPPDVPRAPILAESTRRTVCYVVGGSEKTLLSLVDLGCIVIHVMNSRVTALERPDWLAFDLDPSSGSFRDAAKAGRLLHGILEELRLRSYPKTSVRADFTSSYRSARGPTRTSSAPSPAVSRCEVSR